MKEIFVLGTRAVFYNWKFIVLFWITNTAIAVILSTPIYYILIDNLNHSIMSDRLAAGFDYIWYLQLRSLYEKNIEEIPYLIYGAVIVFVLIQTFYSGGLISVFNNPKKNHILDFFYGGVKYWYRFTKVVLISLFFYAIVFWINDLFGRIITSAFANSENELFEFILRSMRYILLVFFIAIISLISDYSRVCLAVKDKNTVTKGIYSTIIFIKRNFTRVFSVFIIIAIIFAAGALIYNIIGGVIPRTPYYFLVLSFFMQQLLIIFRLLIRMLFYSTDVIIYKDLSAEIVATIPRE